MANDYSEIDVKEIVDRERDVLLRQIEVHTRLAAAREKTLALCQVTRNTMAPVCLAVLAAFIEQRAPQNDADLDDEQPISLNVRLTLGDIRKMRRVM